MKIPTLVVVLLLPLALVTEPKDAAANLPANCGAASATRAYNVGVASGRSITDSAWNGVGQDPDRLQEFKDAIVGAFQNVTLPTGASVAAQCRLAGLIDGSLARVVVIQDTVVDQCILDGEFFGAFVGETYCDLSVSLGGLGVAGVIVRPTNPGPCGANYQSSCDAEFNSTTAAIGVCAPYLVAPYVAARAEYRNNGCGY